MVEIRTLNAQQGHQAPSKMNVSFLLIIAALIWLGSGIYIVDESDSNTIVGNTLSENESDEIDVEGSSNQII